MVDFKIIKINNKIFNTMRNSSYPNDCWVSLDDLRLLNIGYYDFYDNIKEGKIICNKFISEDLLYIFRQLYESKYQLSSVDLIDTFDADDIKSMQANNSSCFNFRKIDNTDKISKHSMGLAVDINPLQNPVVYDNNGDISILPKESCQYSDRQNNFSHKITKDDLVYKLFKDKNFIWGGDWDNPKDYHHFEVSDDFVKILYPNYNPQGSFEENVEAAGDRTKPIVPLYKTKVFMVIFIIIFLALIAISLSTVMTGFGG